MFGFFGRRKDHKTFKPLQSHKAGTKRADLHTLARKTLGTGDVAAAVALPPGEDRHEWLAMQTSEFYNETLLLFSLIEDELTPEKFPSMTAGPKYEYLWQDGVDYKRPTKLPARQYIQNLLTWVEMQLNSQAIFPTDPGRSFPSDFDTVVQRIFRRLFRVYAHIYFHHWESIRAIGADAHLNTCFKQFIFFVKHFDLVPEEELAPLAELIASFLDDHSKALSAAAAAGSSTAAAAADGSGTAAAAASSAPT